MTNNILQSRVAIVIISILWGIGLALLFRIICQNNKCLVVNVIPDDGDIIKENGQCYQIHKYDTTCSN